MEIIVDTGQKRPWKVYHPEIAQLEEMGHTIRRHKMSSGDYATSGSRRVVDTKSGMHELMLQLGRPEKLRLLVTECVRANSRGRRVVFIVTPGEDDSWQVRNMEDLPEWHNPALDDPRAEAWECKPLTGAEVYALMLALSDLTGCEWIFCETDNLAEEIIKVLSDPSSLPVPLQSERVWIDHTREGYKCSRCNSELAPSSETCPRCGRRIQTQVPKVDPRDVIRWYKERRQKSMKKAG